MKKLWHITRKSNISSILIHGIIPSFGEGITTPFFRNKNSKFIFLTNDPVYILKFQCGEKWCKEHHPYILEIDIEDLDVLRYSSSNIECVVYKPIPPSKIKKIIPFNKWKGLNYARCNR